MLAFRCRRSGLLYPEDYTREWGVKYGIGMGPIPVSESLYSMDHLQKAKAFNGDDMHPLGLSYAQLDLVEVTAEEFAAKKAVIHADDPHFIVRSPILIEKQKAKDVATAQATLTAALTSQEKRS